MLVNKQLRKRQYNQHAIWGDGEAAQTSHVGAIKREREIEWGMESATLNDNDPERGDHLK